MGIMTTMVNITPNTHGIIADTQFPALRLRLQQTLRLISLIMSITEIMITGTIGTTGSTSITENTMTVNTNITVALLCLPAVLPTRQEAQFPHLTLLPLKSDKHLRHLFPILPSLRISIMDLTHQSLVHLVSCLPMVLVQLVSVLHRTTPLTGLLAHIRWTAQNLAAS